MGLFANLSQLRKAAKAGGNFGFVAQNIAAIYYAIPLTPFGKTLSEDQRLFATGLIDASIYINNGSITSEDIEDCVLMGKTGNVCIGLYRVQHREMFDLEDNATLVGFAMQLEAFIFCADMPKMDYRDIVNAVVQKKGIIASTISKTLQEGTKSSIFPAVMQNTTIMMASPDFQNVVSSYS